MSIWGAVMLVMNYSLNPTLYCVFYLQCQTTLSGPKWIWQLH